MARTTIEITQPSNTTTYTVDIQRDGVWVIHGRANCQTNSSLLIDECGAVRATGYPVELITKAHRLYQAWLKDNPPGEEIIPRWHLLDDPYTRRKYAEGPNTKVCFEYNNGPRVQIHQLPKSSSKSAPVEVIMAVIKANKGI